MDKILVCDIDGCLADTVSTALDWFNYQFGTRHIPSDINKWNPVLNINSRYTVSFADWMVASIKDPDFHRDVKAFPGARDVLQNALLDGWQVYLATARAAETEILTEQWLHWNGIPYTHLLHEPKKHKLTGNLLIEDNLQNVLDWSGRLSGKDDLRPALLMDRMYNQSNRLPWPISRVRDWIDIDMYMRY